MRLGNGRTSPHVKPDKSVYDWKRRPAYLLDVRINLRATEFGAIQCQSRFRNGPSQKAGVDNI